METIAPLGSGAEGSGYYAQYLANGDEKEGETVAQVFQNEASKTLGLSATATPRQIEELMCGKHNGNDLIQGAGDAHRAGLDVTFSAPKSVSVLKASAELSSNNNILALQIQSAHDRAVNKALHLIEADTGRSRVGKAGSEGYMKGSIVAASFSHQTSREGDPQLHSHNLVMNLIHGEDGKWRSHSNEQLFLNKMIHGAAYRAELSYELKQLGLSIEPDGDSFKVSGVDEGAVKQFSKRRATIETIAKKYGVTAAKGMERIANQSKSVKDKTVSIDELKQSWREQISGLNLTPDAIVDMAKSVDMSDELAHVIARDAVLEKLTSNNSTFTARDLRKEAMVIAGHLALGADAGDVIAKKLISDNEILAVGCKHNDEMKFTTRFMLDMEIDTLAWAKAASKADSFILSSDAIDRTIESKTLTKQQAKALKSLAGGEAISVLEGMAGTGKSYLMSAYREVAEADGYRVIGAALAGKAAAGLEEGAGIKSGTIHRLLIDLDSGKETLSTRDIIVIDEAAMSDNILLAKVAKAAQEAGAKVVLLGDARQLQSIGAGGLFDHISNEIGKASLTEIWRQNSRQDIGSVHDLANGNAKDALAYYQDNNRLHIQDKTEDIMKSMVTDWHADHNDMTDKIMMAGRRVDVAEINLLARKAISETLGRSHTIQTEEGSLELAQGDRILLKKNDSNLNVKNGDTGTVSSLRTDNLTGQTMVDIALDNGKSISFSTDDYDAIRHGYCVTSYAAQGVTVQSSYTYASKFMSREMAYVMQSRYKEVGHLYASAEEFSTGFSNESKSTTERLEFVMSQSNKKETAIQVAESHGYTLSDVLDGNITIDTFANDNLPDSQPEELSEAETVGVHI